MSFYVRPFLSIVFWFILVSFLSVKEVQDNVKTRVDMKRRNK